MRVTDALHANSRRPERRNVAPRRSRIESCLLSRLGGSRELGCQLLLRRPDRPLVPRAPAAGIDLREKIAQRLVEQRRLLDVHGVAALREDPEAVARWPLEVDAWLDAGVVLVAEEISASGARSS